MSKELKIQDKLLLEKIASRVKQMREDKSLSQMQLSADSNLDIRLIQRLEAGKTNVRILTIEKISDGLGISLSEFFDFEEV